MSESTNHHDLLNEWQQALQQGMAAWQAMAAPQAAAATQIFQQTVAQGLTAWSHLAQQDQGPSDALAGWKKSLDQVVEILAKSLAETMASEQFAALMGQALQQYLHAVGPARKHLETVSEDVLHTCNLPSRTQVTRLAASVVGVDERVESVDDRLEALQEQLKSLAAQMAALQAEIRDHFSRIPAERPLEKAEATQPPDADRAPQPKRRSTKEGQA
jgi:chaperonin cofactor prefoldin